jgi:preprotein translocase subunit SecB
MKKGALKTAASEGRLPSPNEFNSYLRTLQLESLRLIRLESSLSRAVDKDEKLDLGLSITTADFPSESGIAFDLGFSLEVSAETESEVANINIIYRVEFVGTSAPPEGFGNVFGELSLYRLVMPYVRETVTNIASKMELPPLYLPLDVFGGGSVNRQSPASPKTRAKRK